MTALKLMMLGNYVDMILKHIVVLKKLVRQKLEIAHTELLKRQQLRKQNLIHIDLDYI
jgi:hypothetical protein